VAFNGSNNEWEDGARLSTSHFNSSNLPLAEAQKIKAISLDLYLEPHKMSTGTLLLNVCPIPNGDGYWYQAGSYEISAANAATVKSKDGPDLWKYHIEVPLSSDGNYPFTVSIRNLVLALQSQGSDYNGMVYYDNIGFVN
jgi:hypothetical protein